MNRLFGRRVVVAGVLAVLPGMVAAQEGATVTGRVASQDGALVAYATVAIEQLGLGTLSRDDGRYTIVVPGARVLGQTVTLAARAIGYKAASVQVALSPGTLTQDFALQANPLQIGEIVVTGAGTVAAAEKLGNVRNNVDSSLIQRSNESNIVSALAAKAPNVEVTSSSGEPGASAFIRIRGVKTIQGTGQPLFVVDGVPIDNLTVSTSAQYDPANLGDAVGGTSATNRAGDINPADIESIEILKGAAAGAIYGARAGQGVILITTKSGRPGATRYSLRTSVSSDRVNKFVPLQRRFGHGSNGVAFSCPGEDCFLPGQSFGPELPAGTPVFDHARELFQTGHVADNTLTVSGGNDRTTFYVSASWLGNAGTIVGPNDEHERLSVRLKAAHRLFESLTVGGNIMYSDVRGGFIQRGSNTSGLLLGALRTPPTYDSRDYRDPVYGLHRSYRFPQPGPLSQTTTRVYDNPFFVANEHQNTFETGRVVGNLSVSYQPVPWLRLQEVLGADYWADERLDALPQSSSHFPEGQVIRADLVNSQFDHNLTATASYTLNPSLSGTVMLGQNLSSRHFEQVGVVGQTLVAPEPFKLSNTVDRQTPNDNEQKIRTESYFGQVTVDVRGQLFLTGALRNDGSSAWSTNDQRHWFPKASAAWIFTTALGERTPDFLSFGKLRVAYGQAGQEPQPYQTLSTFATAFFSDGGWGPSVNPGQGGAGGLYSGPVRGQDDLKPERTREVEGGIDLALLRERVDLSLTRYDSKSTDVIFLAPLAPSTGFAFQAQNAATITNKGWEVVLNVRPIATATLSWDVGLQWATNDNRVVDLQGAEFVNVAGGFDSPRGAAVRGSRVGVLRGFDFARCGRGVIDAVEGDIDAKCGGASAGALYIDPSGFPIFDPTVRVIADPHPDWTASVRTGLRYKKWHVSGLLDIKHGGDVWNGTRGALKFFGTHKETEIRGQTRTFGANHMPGAVAGPGAGTPVVIDQTWYRGLGSFFSGGPDAQDVEDGGFVKLREISLGYTLDGRWVRERIGLTSIDLRVAGRNLYTWTDYSGIDPETNLEGAEVGLRGVDFFNNPQTRSFVFTVVLTY